MKQVLWRITHIWIKYRVWCHAWVFWSCHCEFMQPELKDIHFWSSGTSKCWATIPNKAKFTQEHVLSIMFLLIVLERCFIPHHAMKHLFYSHPPFRSFSRPFLLFYFFCTQERIIVGLSNGMIWSENDGYPCCWTLTWTQDLRHIFSSVLISLVGLGDIYFHRNVVIKSCHVTKPSIGNQKAPNEVLNAYSFKWYRLFNTMTRHK